MQELLRTDAYKLSMAQAGFPLREETFYFSFRKGGWHFVPFDLEAEVQALLPDLGPDSATDRQLAYAQEAGYALSPAMVQALRGAVSISAVPAKSWVAPREPLLTVRGPSFLVSWLEPLILRLHHAIQIATQLKRGTWTEAMGMTVGEEHALLVRRVADAVGAVTPSLRDEVDAYRKEVQRRGTELVEILGDPSRVFEVGMRAAVSESQHRIALEALRGAGIRLTSNMSLARELDLRPVGTMGHEHVQRWGDDLAAFRAMRDTRLGAPSYLLDTFDTIGSGIPNAIRVMREREHACSIRYDSGDIFAQYMYAHGEFRQAGLSPTHILEDGLDADATRKFESLREFTGLAPEQQLYGYGGHLVARPARNPLTRDRVAAVYKLCESSTEARMKFGNESGLGKRSVPGSPVAWRRVRGQGPLSIIGQSGETPPEDFIVLNANPEARAILDLVKTEQGLEDPEAQTPYLLSPQTQALERELEAKKAKHKGAN